MDIMIGILGIVVGIIIAVAPFLWKRYVARPELTIELLKDGGSSSPKGLSHKNVVNEEGYIDGLTAIRVFELTWKFQIRVTNNSELTAFYPELTYNPYGPRFDLIDKLNTLQPIKPTESIVLKAVYKKYEEKTGEERTDVGRQMPEEFSDLGLLLTYKNSHKITFFTLFDFNEKTNRFLIRKPNEYKNN
jgi:hypothetical protein